MIMKNRLLNLLLVLLMVCSFSSCSLFGYDLQEDYDYEYTPGNAYLEQTAYGFIQSRKDIDMGILYQAIERVGFKEEYEASDRTFIVMNDVAFVAYFQTKKYAGLENMSDKDIKDLLNSLMLEEAVTSLDLTINPVAMSPINKNKTMYMWINTVTGYNMRIHYAAVATAGTSVVTSNIRPTNGVIHVVDKYPLN